MDGTLEQLAHTNDETLTGHAENDFLLVMFFSLSCYFCLENDHKGNDCVPQLDKLLPLSMTGDCTSRVNFYLTMICTERSSLTGLLQRGELKGNECLKEI